MSEMAVLYGRMLRKELPVEEYNQLMAAWVAEHLGEYPEQHIPGLGGVLRSYVRDRIQGLRAYEDNSAKMLGYWARGATRVLEENNKNRSLLEWSMEKLKGAKAGTLATRIEVRLLIWGERSPPREDLHQAQQVLALDAYARTHSSRRSF